MCEGASINSANSTGYRVSQRVSINSVNSTEYRVCQEASINSANSTEYRVNQRVSSISTYNLLMTHDGHATTASNLAQF